MKKSKSIIFNIQLLAVILSAFMVMFVAASFLVVYFNEKRNESKKAIKIYHAVEDKKKLAKRLGYMELENKEEIEALNLYGKNLLLDDDMIKSFALGNITMLTYNDYYYFYFKPSDIYFKSTYHTSSVLLYATLFFTILGVLFYLLIAYIRRSILPLQQLYQKIELFGQGNVNVDTRSNNVDEVAQVGNAFYSALTSIKTLESNRQLFIQNISHELKTPLTKNNLMIHTLSDEFRSLKEGLLKNNQQINDIIDTISHFDSLQSRHLHLNKTMVNIIDLVEEAIEESEIDETLIHFEIQQTSKQYVDFGRMVLAIKNLLRNAYLHSGENSIDILLEKTKLTIFNHALTLEALDFQKVNQAFYKADNTTQGMGLGLYIVNNIIDMHEFKLDYRYDSLTFRHRFIINFS